MAQTAHHWRKFHANFHLHCVSLWLCVAVLCAERVGQMTKTYSDIDAVTRLLEEVWSGLRQEHTARTCNPSFNCFIFWISFHLELMTNWQRSSLVKRKSFVKICITITLCSFVFTMIASLLTVVMRIWCLSIFRLEFFLAKIQNLATFKNSVCVTGNSCVKPRMCKPNSCWELLSCPFLFFKQTISTVPHSRSHH